MHEKAVEDEPEALEYVPNYFKIQKMCERAIEEGLYNLKFVPDCLKMQDMCYKAVKDDSSSLQYVPNWFVTRKWVYMWYDDYYDDDGDHSTDDEDKFFGWYNGYKKQKAQKAWIKKELMSIAWHPSRHWDWCMPEDEKKETEKLWA